ncbi:hypothetical protein QQF64_005531 [Cirrhinus molitorella]|uniref:Uncharacterized protein n=2 Tax=Cirrhinus molitorella TaxID=172907 RepID=A0ABR3MCJ3_9TELE|nr:hypothetical protein Q8A67_011362 [Cirrhinus molitorella]
MSEKRTRGLRYLLEYRRTDPRNWRERPNPLTACGDTLGKRSQCVAGMRWSLWSARLQQMLAFEQQQCCL